MDTTVRPFVTEHDSRRRLAGLAGVAGGVAWVPLVVAEGGAEDPTTGVALGFAAAMAGYVVMLVAVHAARPGGRSRPARVFTGLLVIAWVALLAGHLVEITTTQSAEVVGPIGGLGQAIGLTGAGVLAARAGAWSGWRRWWLLAMAGLFVVVLFVPAILGIEPSLFTESLWALSYAGLGLALVAES